MIFILPCVDTYTRVDMRTMSFDVPPQEVSSACHTLAHTDAYTDNAQPLCVLQVLTKDSVTIKVDAVIYYRIYDPVMAVTNVANVHNASNLLAQSLLRNTLGTRNLVSLLADLEHVSTAMQVPLAALCLACAV